MFYLCCQFISDDVTWGRFLLYVPHKSWATFYPVNLFMMMHRQMNWNCNQAMIMTKLIINLGGDSGGGGGGAELVNWGVSPWIGYCQCFSHLAHDRVQVLFLLLQHIPWLVHEDVSLLIFLVFLRAPFLPLLSVHLRIWRHMGLYMLMLKVWWFEQSDSGYWVYMET